MFDILKRERIPTTIFVSGRWVEGHPEVMTELAADPMVEFGDHSYEHPHMSHLPVARIVERDRSDRGGAGEIRKAQRGVSSAVRRVELAPGLRRAEPAASDRHLGRRLGRSERANDHGRDDPRRSLGKARAGSIIIFHINGRGHKTAEALPAIVRGLRERGFRFVQLSELMASSRAAPALVAPIPLAPLPPAAADGSPAPPAIAPHPGGGACRPP